jgi:hypothetical protein
METSVNRFYIYGDAYFTIANNKQPDLPPGNKGHCKVCGWNYAGATKGLTDGDEWELCASCRFDKMPTNNHSACWGYKTKRCYRFKSSEGCYLGDACTFMHDTDDKGIVTNEPSPIIIVDDNGASNQAPMVETSPGDQGQMQHSKGQGPRTELLELETPKYKFANGMGAF